MTILHNSFTEALTRIKADFLESSRLTSTETWQSLDVSDKPDMVTHELRHYSFHVYMRHEKLPKYRYDIIPNLPWADDHFSERIGGKPLNPPPSEAWWPHAKDNLRFKNVKGQFSHTYPERYWPKTAGNDPGDLAGKNFGIRYAYGDLRDVIALLQREPNTRQAYLPIFFPEDTGAVSRQRIPCSLGYHFLKRDEHLDIVYFMRSCDAYNHLRDDIYLTVRLLLWILDELRLIDLNWMVVKPGRFVMHISSLHCFVNDYRKLIA